MVIPRRTGFAAILDSIKAQLVDEDVQDENCIFYALQDEEPPHLVGDGDLLLVVGRVTKLQRVVGGGRTDRRVRRTLEVWIRTRLALDEVGQDSQFLTRATVGHLAREEAVLDALDNFMPEAEIEGSNYLLCYEPMIWNGASRPIKDRRDASWGGSIVDFEVPYLLSLDQGTV